MYTYTYISIERDGPDLPRVHIPFRKALGEGQRRRCKGCPELLRSYPLG